MPMEGGYLHCGPRLGRRQAGPAPGACSTRCTAHDWCRLHHSSHIKHSNRSIQAPVPTPYMLSRALRAATRCTAVALEGSATYWQAWAPGGVLDPQNCLSEEKVRKWKLSM